MNNLISSALHQLLIPMELHNITLHIDIPKGVRILGDLNWLSEAIQNIFKNCMESVGDNGKIDIICEDNFLFTQLTIHDNGAGFKKKIYHVYLTDFIVGKIQAQLVME